MMKFPPSPVLCALGVAALLCAGCDTAPVRQPKTTQKVVLAADRPSPDVPMDVMTAIQVVLPDTDAHPGYVWEIAANNNRILEEMGPLRAGPGAGPSTMSFYALKPGWSVLRFFLVRPGEAEATPAAKCQVTVRVTDD
jgi:hypothetical protein